MCKHLLCALNYADDIMLTSNDAEGEEHHLEMLDCLLGNCDQLYIRLNSHKTHLFDNVSIIVGFCFKDGRFEIPISKSRKHPKPSPAYHTTTTHFLHHLLQVLLNDGWENNYSGLHCKCLQTNYRFIIIFRCCYYTWKCVKGL